MTVASPFPPKLTKGALVSIAPLTFQKTTVSFQFNPATLSRSLRPVTVGTEDGTRSQAIRFTGAPTQTINLEAHVDCMDELNAGEQSAIQYGCHPQLAVLESMLYPSITGVAANQVLAAVGMLEIVPLTAPSTLFVWGSNRVLPVRLTSLAVTEQLFDGSLNPVQAEVALEMRVLSYSDVTFTNPDYYYFFEYQSKLQSMAAAALGSGGLGYDLSKLL